MIKALFVVGQCLRALHTDPWQSDTIKVLQVGQYSYQVETVKEAPAGAMNVQAEDGFVLFEEQSRYKKVSCPNGEDNGNQ